MPDAGRPLKGSRRGPRRLGVAVAALALVAAAAPVAAQDEPLGEPPSRAAFLPRIDLRMSATALSHDDPRFSWVADWGGDLDLVDYVWGRLTVLAVYQAVLGDELQPFDPNQGNYTLAVSSSLRAGRTELVGVFYHRSRHLGDRAKDFGIAWNTLNGRLLRRWSADRTTFDLRVEVGRVLATAYVDYRWVSIGEFTVRQSVSQRVGLYGRVSGDLYGVDPAIAGREPQRGGRVEGGIRLSGLGGALELFGGFEQMVDADPIDRLSQKWAFAGFRLRGR